MAIKIIGITGQVGSGKTTVANIMREIYGAHILIADSIANELMQKGGISYRLICNNFGDSILDEEGNINKKLLSEIVFQDIEKLEILSSLIHPFVMNYIFDEIRIISKEANDGYIVIESAILIEAGYKEICDEVWYVQVNEQEREHRLIHSRGYTKEKIQSILKNQLSNEEFIQNASHIIYNNGELESIKEQLKYILVV